MRGEAMNNEQRGADEREVRAPGGGNLWTRALLRLLDAARAERDAAVARAEGMRAERDSESQQLAACDKQLIETERERDALRAEVARLRGLLERTRKYVREDRAVTPRATRLERLMPEIDDALSPVPVPPEAAPEAADEPCPDCGGTGIVREPVPASEAGKGGRRPVVGDEVEVSDGPGRPWASAEVFDTGDTGFHADVNDEATVYRRYTMEGITWRWPTSEAAPPPGGAGYKGPLETTEDVAKLLADTCSPEEAAWCAQVLRLVAGAAREAIGPDGEVKARPFATELDLRANRADSIAAAPGDGGKR